MMLIYIFKQESDEQSGVLHFTLGILLVFQPCISEQVCFFPFDLNILFSTETQK